jgi:hypothetical protein
VAGLHLAAVVALYLLRIVLAPASTLRGLRQMVLDATPIPGAEHGSGRVAEDKIGDRDGDQGAGQPVIGFGTKKAAFLSFYRAHSEYGNRSVCRAGRRRARTAGRPAGRHRAHLHRRGIAQTHRHGLPAAGRGGR